MEHPTEEPSLPPPRVIALEEYYRWSAESLADIERMSNVVRELLRAIAQNMRASLERSGFTTGSEIDDFQALDDDAMTDAVSVLGFLERLPNGAVEYMPEIPILAVRHQANNTLQRLFSCLDWLDARDPHRMHFESLSQKYLGLQQARHSIKNSVPPHA